MGSSLEVAPELESHSVSAQATVRSQNEHTHTYTHTDTHTIYNQVVFSLSLNVHETEA